MNFVCLSGLFDEDDDEDDMFGEKKEKKKSTHLDVDSKRTLLIGFEDFPSYSPFVNVLAFFTEDLALPPQPRSQRTIGFSSFN